MSQSPFLPIQLASEIAKIHEQSRRDISNMFGSVLGSLNSSAFGIDNAIRELQLTTSIRGDYIQTVGRAMSQAQEEMKLFQRNMFAELGSSISIYQDILRQQKIPINLGIARAVEQSMTDYRAMIGQIGSEAFSSVFASMDISIAIDELINDLEELEVEPMDAEALETSQTELIRQTALEIGCSRTADQLFEVLNSINEKLSDLTQPARKTVLLILFGIVSTYFCSVIDTWWASYIRDYRLHRIEYRQGVEALETLTETAPSFSISNVSGVTRTPCVAVKNVNGILHQAKVSAGTLVKVTKRNGKSIEIHWYDSGKQLSGWINITHVRYPKRFR
ncbi:hypothetical protein FHS27_000002 [Rhodopirellula rubra]|uniref:Uncharacterized protein n=1 Tax=Aporhodopirellula rubra TaxID=980271 RepID=A0A7W5DUE5_9BACT|nr:hypothetical protein [Aporhodopirellula rubra]MBB3204238.1 hypothetical protein [Aporhodopirellula rubra]